MGKTITFLLSWQLKKLEVSLKPNCLKQDSSLAGFFVGFSASLQKVIGTNLQFSCFPWTKLKKEIFMETFGLQNLPSPLMNLNDSSL